MNIPRGRSGLGPIVRISFGLVALLVSLLMLADLVFGLLPDRDDALRRTRQRVAENLSVQIIALLESGNDKLLASTLQQVLARDADLRAVTIRRVDGSTLLRRGTPDPRAGATARVDAGQGRGSASTTDQLRVPIHAGQRLWGEIELQFAPPAHSGGWLPAVPPGLQLVGLLGLGGFALFYLYLRRAMQYLNPSASVPDRVRKAFDALTEGLLIIDQESRIVLANRAFRALHPLADRDLNGQRIGALGWLGAAPAAPWAHTLKAAEAVNAWPLALAQPDGAATQLMVSSAPITDDKGRARGCLITFDNVTAVHRANEELRSTLGELEKSRQRIEEQNGELRRLASRDPLTGCLNRRAFFDATTELFEAARRRQTPLCCVMADIDHFKQFNDRYGHAVGDEVIQVVARALAAGLRPADVLCRYGGEEFCIVLPGATPAEAQAVAERIRAAIEAAAASAIRGTAVMPITSSFGLASVALGARTLEELIDQADQALYRSKQGGRNRVTVWARLSEVAHA